MAHHRKATTALAATRAELELLEQQEEENQRKKGHTSGKPIKESSDGLFSVFSDETSSESSVSSSSASAAHKNDDDPQQQVSKYTAAMFTTFIEDARKQASETQRRNTTERVQQVSVLNRDDRVAAYVENDRREAQQQKELEESRRTKGGKRQQQQQQQQYFQFPNSSGSEGKENSNKEHIDRGTQRQQEEYDDDDDDEAIFLGTLLKKDRIHRVFHEHCHISPSKQKFLAQQQKNRRMEEEQQDQRLQEESSFSRSPPRETTLTFFPEESSISAAVEQNSLDNFKFQGNESRLTASFIKQEGEEEELSFSTMSGDKKELGKDQKRRRSTAVPAANLSVLSKEEVESKIQQQDEKKKQKKIIEEKEPATAIPVGIAPGGGGGLRQAQALKSAAAIAQEQRNRIVNWRNTEEAALYRDPETRTKIVGFQGMPVDEAGFDSVVNQLTNEARTVQKEGRRQRWWAQQKQNAFEKEFRDRVLAAVQKGEKTKSESMASRSALESLFPMALSEARISSLSFAEGRARWTVSSEERSEWNDLMIIGMTLGE